MASSFIRISYLLIVFASIGTHANQEVVQASGIGIAPSKAQACEVALDLARREAAQQATSMVEASFSSVENDKGVAHRSDQIVTTKAFAKLVDKVEKASFDSETGQIECEVRATFKAGFVEASAVEERNTDDSSVSISDFKAGRPFCSKLMDMCFREIYSKQLDKFGLQVLPTDKGRIGHNGESLKGAFFNSVRLSLRGSSIEVTTKEKLIETLKALKDKGGAIMHLYAYVYRLDRKKGFTHDRTSAGTDGYSAITGSARPPLMRPNASKEYIDSLDVKMTEIQGNLEHSY